MSVSTEISRIIAAGNGVTITYSYNFPIVGASDTDQTNARLVYTDTTGVSTTMADNLWSITGVVTQPTDWASGTFRLSTSTPITTGATLTLERTQPYTQTTTLGNQGSYSPEVVEAALDNLALQTEQLNTWRLQSLRAPIEDDALVDLPGEEARASGFLFFDSSGQPTIVTSTSGIPVSGIATAQPQGRLTLQSAHPVMTGDVTAVSTVYYDSYIGNSVPIFATAGFSPLTITGDEISLALNTTDNLSAHLYDIFAFSSSGTLTLGTGPAWTSATVRSAAISLKNGVWTNTASIVLRAGGASLGTITANQATYLGTVYCTANGQTGMAFQPAAASGGSNNILGLYNAYNRVLFTATEQDSTSSWTYGTAAARPTNNNANNRISWIDGLQQSPVQFSAHVAAQISANTPSAVIWANVDSISAVSTYLTQLIVASATQPLSMNVNAAANPLLGFHYVQQMEFASGATVSFVGGSQYQYLTLTLAM